MSCRMLSRLWHLQLWSVTFHVNKEELRTEELRNGEEKVSSDYLKDKWDDLCSKVTNYPTAQY